MQRLKKIFTNNNGQSLIEVTVALSILVVVLTGVVTLAVNVAGLMIASRMATEATAIAQEGLEALKGAPSSTCAGLSAGGKFEIGGDGLITPDILDDGQNIRKYTRTIETLDDKITGTGSPNLILAQVTVTWEMKSGQPEGEIVLKQIISKNE